MQYAEKLIDGFAIGLSLTISFILYTTKTFPVTFFYKKYSLENAENPELIIFAATWLCTLILISPFMYIFKKSMR